MARTIRLRARLPDGTETQHELSQDSIIVGSGPSATLAIEHPDVSSMHAILKVKDGSVTISDLGSEAGTAVNGKPVTEEVPVGPGDEIALGRVAMRYEPGTAEESDDVAKNDDKKDEAAKAEGSTEKKVDKTIGASGEAATDLIRDPDAIEAEAAEAPAAAEAEKPKAEKPKKAAAKAPTSGAPSRDDLTAQLADPLPEYQQPTAAKHALEVKVVWGDTIVDADQISKARDVTVSGLKSVRGADIQVEANLPVTEWTIARNRGSEAEVIVPADAKVALRKADGTITRDVPLQATDAPFPAKAYTLGFGERIAYQIEGLVFVAQYVRGEAAMGRGAPMDWYFPRIFIISALVHGFFVAAAFVTPKIQSTLTDDLFKNQNRFAQMILKAPEEEKKRKKLDLSGSKGGAKHKGEEGKFGKKDIPKKDALASKAGAPRVDPNKREKDRKVAMNAGLLGILKGGAGSGAVSNVFGPGGLGTGINNAMGGLRGTAMGDAGGAGGLGDRGAGAGGGGNSLGIGGLGTHGHGRGTGGYGNIDLGGRGKGTTRVVPGRTIIKGSLSKEEIGRVIRRNLARFKYCYEKQLNANPNLAGKVSVYFTIAPTGSVASASVRETSLNDTKVEDCVTKVMTSLKFPQPRGGGVVVVTYPFVFAAT